MSQKRARPPAATGDLRSVISFPAIASELPQAIPEIHSRRAYWLARRFGLTDTMAAAVANLYFLEAAR